MSVGATSTPVRVTLIPGVYQGRKARVYVWSGDYISVLSLRVVFTQADVYDLTEERVRWRRVLPGLWLLVFGLFPLVGGSHGDLSALVSWCDFLAHSAGAWLLVEPVRLSSWRLSVRLFPEWSAKHLDAFRVVR